ncbi:MAG: hypothetical protein LBU65_09265 [Planctomycetaceae bacterium]|jgi:hypothetical protein|nr:hypothetical protein [Planctomycetaceae bacterium]
MNVLSAAARHQLIPTMKINDFFIHHGILGNPFSEEDAQVDLVFKSQCIKTTYHPSWDKLFGSPAEASTSIVFGEKGAGKTALRLQMACSLGEYNAEHPDKRPLVIGYDDFNPFLDSFRSRFSAKCSTEKVLDQFKLWDHLDAILSLGTTQIVDRILYPAQVSYPAADTRPVSVDKLTQHQKRDLLGLLVCYDNSRSEESQVRFLHLMRKLRFRSWSNWFSVKKWIILAVTVIAIMLAMLGCHYYNNGLSAALFGMGKLAVIKYVLITGVVVCLPEAVRRCKRCLDAFRLRRSIYVLRRMTKKNQNLLLEFPQNDYVSLPLPFKRESNNRYELLERFLKIIDTLGFSGMIVLIDRVDEPYLINGQTQLMKRFVWSMLDNKLLQYPGIGIKMLLLDSLLREIYKEPQEFRDRCRLDKQNLVRNLDWTGESLYDLVNSRLNACRSGDTATAIDQFFEPKVTKQRLLDAFERLKVPRHLFKFLYKLMIAHCNMFTDSEPSWLISAETFETTLAVDIKEREVANNTGYVN